MKRAHILIKSALCILAAFGCASELCAKKQTDNAPESQNERHFSYFFQEAVKQRLAGNYAEAIDLLAQCNSNTDKNDALAAELSAIYREKGNSTLARVFGNLAVLYAPDNYWHYVNFANILINQKEYDQAAELLEKMTEKFPEEEIAFSTLISIYQQQNKLAEAIAVLNRMEKRQGISEEVSFEKFRCYAAQNQLAKAEKELIAIIEKFPNETRYRLTLGNFYLNTDNNEKALQIYQDVLQKEPENSLARFAMAKFYEKNGFEEKAIEEMDAALRSRNADFETKIEILKQYLTSVQNTKEWQARVAKLFETLEEIHPEVASVHNYYASYLQLIGENEKAIAQMQQSLELDPSDKEVWTWFIANLTENGQTDLALEKAAEAQKANPDEASFYLMEAAVHFRLKNYEKSVSVAQKALTIATEKKDFLTASNICALLGDLYQEQKNVEKSFEMYEKGLSFSSSNTQILNNYGYALAVQNRNLAKAEKMAKLCLKMEPGNIHVIDTYAWILFRQGYYHLAQQMIERIIGNPTISDAENAVIYEHYGDILSKTDNADVAVEAWKKAVEFGCTSPTIMQKINSKTYVE